MVFAGIAALVNAPHIFRAGRNAGIMAGADAVEALAQRVLSARTAETCGLSFSGGEPFQQALALADLARRVRGAWPEVSLLAFTGYTLEDLRGASAPTGSASLLAQLDLLVDGPYLREAETVRPWRASANQRLWVLGRRTEKSFKNAPLATEIQAEIQVEPDGRVLLSGFPDAALRRAIRELAR